MTFSLHSGLVKKPFLGFSMLFISAMSITALAYLLTTQHSAWPLSYVLAALILATFLGGVTFFFSRKKDSSFSIPTISEYATVQEPIILPPVPRRWSIRLLSEMEWKRFEALCLNFFIIKGANATLISKGTNGYIELRRDSHSKISAVVKHKTALKDVGVKEIKSLLALMARLNVDKGFYMTAGSFSAEAKVFAKENKVVLISGGMLLTMLKRLRNSQQKKLLSKAVEGDYKTPTCPACNIKMVSLHGTHLDKYYWGCVNKPVCKHIRPRREQRVRPR